MLRKSAMRSGTWRCYSNGITDLSISFHAKILSKKVADADEFDVSMGVGPHISGTVDRNSGSGLSGRRGYVHIGGGARMVGNHFFVDVVIPTEMALS